MAEQKTNYFIHESSYIDDNVKIGSGTKVWHFCHILSGTKIGKNCSFGQNVMAGPDVIIGDGCKIQNNVSLYKGVILEEGVFCGPSMVFTNVTTPRSEVNRQNEYSQTLVRKGVTIGANATIVCGHELGEYSFVAAGAVITKNVIPHALMAGVPAKQIGWVAHSGEILGEDLTCPRTGDSYEVVSNGLQRKP
jgi:UDP-2-acetamido-3-amino-2,3-dideoxy-glucuronate N-acetyltransferase